MSTFSFGSRSVITGGTFTQVNNNVQARSSQTPWEHLQSRVSLAARHNSAKRFDSPQCHPNTRVALMNELRDLALRRGDAGTSRLLWMNGPAGAGKSAIAQSFCEECASTNSLLASFFFDRSDPSCNTTEAFVATLTYQIYMKVPAYYQALILAVIETDPYVFGLSVDAQLKALIIDPLRDLFRVKYFNHRAPALIVIDGLDECSGAPFQVSILRALESITTQSNPSFVFLVTSRPEHTIQMFLASSRLGNALHRLNLDASYLPDLDIELFLRERLQDACATHPLKHTIPQGWPSCEVIQAIVQKSSGQFIYASVVVKYVTSSRHYPPDRLDVVLQLRPPKRDLPFAELDAFYSHIFSCVKDIALVLRILCIVVIFESNRFKFFPADIDYLCELDLGECLSALYDLQSVLQLDPTGIKPICFLHKSLPDYLQDPIRSHKYYIDATASGITLTVTQCLRCISDLALDYDPKYLDFISDHLSLLIRNIQLCHKDLMAFSLRNCWNTCQGMKLRNNDPLRHSLMWFTFDFLDRLCTLEDTDHEYIYLHHLNQIPALVEEYMPEENYRFPMAIVSTLLGNSDSQIISPKVFELLQKLLSTVPANAPELSPTKFGLENMFYSAAKHCISSLEQCNGSKSATSALQCLPLILLESKLSPDLNMACHPGALIAYTMSEDSQLFSLSHKARQAMQEYRECYEEGQHIDWVWE